MGKGEERGGGREERRGGWGRERREGEGEKGNNYQTTYTHK